MRKELVNALGGDVSPQQSLLIDRVAYLLYRITAFESLMLSGKSTPDTDTYYLAWCNSLARLLSLLGLERKAAKLDGLRELLTSGRQPR